VETFDYTAIDKLGKRLSGSISASSAREARDQLRGRALTLTELKAAKQKGASRLTYERNISHKDLTQASRQLAILIDAALTGSRRRAPLRSYGRPPQNL